MTSTRGGKAPVTFFEIWQGCNMCVVTWIYMPFTTACIPGLFCYQWAGCQLISHQDGTGELYAKKVVSSRSAFWPWWILTCLSSSHGSCWIETKLLLVTPAIATMIDESMVVMIGNMDSSCGAIPGAKLKKAMTAVMCTLPLGASRTAVPLLHCIFAAFQVLSELDRDWSNTTRVTSVQCHLMICTFATTRRWVQIHESRIYELLLYNIV